MEKHLVDSKMWTKERRDMKNAIIAKDKEIKLLRGQLRSVEQILATNPDMYEKPAPEKYNFNSKLFQMEECKKTSELAIFMEAAEERGVDYNDLIRINAVLSWQVKIYEEKYVKQTSEFGQQMDHEDLDQNSKVCAFEDLLFESEEDKQVIIDDYEEIISQMEENHNRTKRDFDDLQEAYENKHKDLEELCDMYAKIGKFYDSLGAKIQKLEEVNGIPKKPKRI